MELSGHMLPNNLIAAILAALDELMGTNGLNSLLNAANLQEWKTAPPASTEDRDVDFSQFSALFRTLDDLYGQKGSLSLMRRANSTVFNQLWSEHGAFGYIENPEFQGLDASSRIDRGLKTFSQTLSESSDILAKVSVGDAGYLFSLELCPYCWNTDSDSSQCYAFQGLLESVVSYFAPETKVEIEETTCVGSGETNCTFILNLKP